MRVSMRLVLLFVSLCHLFPAALVADDQITLKEHYEKALSFQSSEPDRTVKALRNLSDQGYGRATERLAHMTFKGRGTVQDSNAAIALYQKAIREGRSASLVPLGKTHMEMGEYLLALEAWKTALEAGHEQASALQAWAHATRRLGEFSQAELGWSDLRAIAENGSRDGQILLLDAAVKINKTPDNVGVLLDRLHALHEDGDAKAAEVLLKYYRVTRHQNGTIVTRSNLLETEGLRDKVRVEESLYLARDHRAEAFWGISETLVGDAPNDVYARALAVTAKINKNAYVRIVQKELRALGYSVGKESPYMNMSLIRSIYKFCQDADIATSCKQGPLKSTTIKSVAAQLAMLRALL